jgi:hypothetical protein
MSAQQRIAHVLASLVAFVMGSAMLVYYLRGLLDVYLDEKFRDHCLIAGVGLLIMAIFNLLTLGRRSASCCDGDDHHQHDDHCNHDDADCAHALGSGKEHAHHHAFFGGETLGSTVVAALLICAMVGYAAMRSPHAFSPRAIINKGLYRSNPETIRSDRSFAKAATDSAQAPDVAGSEDGQSANTVSTEQADELSAFSLADLEAQVDRDDRGYFELQVPELYYTAGDLEVRRVLEGQPVVTVAQVMPEKFNNPEGTRLRIFRIFIECCAADARPLAIPVEFGAKPPEFREMSWVEVRGKMTYQREAGSTVPILLVEEMIDTDEPEQTMMY